TAAQAALKAYPLADNADEFAEALGRAQRAESEPPHPLRSAQPRGRAFAALLANDMHAAAAVAAAAPSWATARAAPAAAAWRGDDHTPVPYAALRAIVEDLEASAGTIARDATLWRVRALALREDAYFPADPPPPLGPRTDAAEFTRKLKERIEDEE